jgi:hypothetical protein
MRMMKLESQGQGRPFRQSLRVIGQSKRGQRQFRLIEPSKLRAGHLSNRCVDISKTRQLLHLI